MDFSANRWVLEKIKNALKLDSHKSVLEYFNVDIVDLRDVEQPVYKGPVPLKKEIEGGVVQNYWGWRTLVKDTPTGPEEMFCDFLFQNAESLDDVQSHTWPRVDWFDFTDFGERLEKWSDFAIMATGASVWQHPSFLRGLDTLLMDVALNNEIGIYIIDKYSEFYTSYFDKMITSSKGRIDILRIADDLGMQERLLVSPDIFNVVFAPRIARIVDMAHSHGVKVMFHSCGAISPLIPGIIDAGVDILDPIQVTAAGMEPSSLKAGFGDRLCFHGSIDTQYLLTQCKPQDVADSVENMFSILGEGGGFILSPSHILQTDVPLENIKALYQKGKNCVY
ncbi:methylcobalamin:coenzyme M methyltransferase [Limihaloglobus sulfuriphilus]|uniref:Methylcobalamin:coenzyme M methyltransferase n=2 Tax=Limihaloglobus sulfuriphilus TaxID=1851148 RepID=A0A1Q2MCT0_9BACT|nr:methylcobalamin:coenzyme M methyltransferase [Limihaloglobus sulfuriphilus]